MPVNFDKVSAYLSSLGDTYGLHAVDCKVMRDHQVLFREMYGHRDYDHRVPISSQDLYDVYSCTKIVTMTAAMQLVEKGMILLDEHVDTYLPAFSHMNVSEEFVPFKFPMKWPALQDRTHPAPTKITIRELMAMTSGLSYDLESEAVRTAVAESQGQAGTVEIVNAIARMPLLFDPGTRYAYSLGHDVIAAVIESVSGQRYADYLQDHIFGPLGLHDMYMHVPESEQDRLSAQYGGVLGSNEIRRMDVGNRYRITSKYDSGGAGLACTVDDYILLLDALACGGTAHNGYRLLSGESIDQMRTPQLNEAAQADFSRSGKVGYGYGLGVRTLTDGSKSKSPVGEFGWDGAAGAYALIDPINHVSIFYAQEVLGMMRSYSEIHPALRDLVYESLEADSGGRQKG